MCLCTGKVRGKAISVTRGSRGDNSVGGTLPLELVLIVEVSCTEEDGAQTPSLLFKSLGCVLAQGSF